MTPPRDSGGRVPATPRPRLTVDVGGVTFRVVIGTDVFSIGSSPRSSLTIERPGVAEHHAVIQRGDQGYEVFDLCSPGGTTVNGVRVEAALLRAGDAIGIGDARLAFLDGAAAPDPTDVRSGLTAEILPLLGLRDEQTSAYPTAAPAAQPPPTVVATEEAITPRVPIALVRAAPLRSFRAFIAEEPSARNAHEWLVAQAKRMPYIAVAMMLHVVAVLLVSLGPWERKRAFEDAPTEAVISAEIVFTPVTDVPVVEPHDSVAELPRADDEAVVIPSGTPEGEAAATDALPTSGSDGPVPDFGVPMADDAGTGLPAGNGTDVIGVGPGGFGGGEGEHGARGAGLEDGDGLFPGNGSGSASFGALRKYAHGLREIGLDVIFVVDATGSMGSSIDDARQRINELIAVIGSLVPRFRLAIVGYRDKGDDFVTKKTPLTDNHYQAVQFLDDLSAGGGGDFPEAVYEGLRVGMRDLPWSKTGGKAARRIVILVGDAPPHVFDDERVNSLVASFASQSGTLHTIYCGGNGTLEDRDSTRMLFARLAKKTGGVALALSDGKRVVDGLLPVIFGREYELGMKEVIENARAGTRARRCRDLVASASPAMLRDEMLRPNPSVDLFNAIADNLKAENFPAFLDVLRRSEASAPARWAASVFVRRIARSKTRAPQLWAVASALAGDLPQPRMKLVTDDISRKAKAVGLATEMPSSNGR